MEAATLAPSPGRPNPVSNIPEYTVSEISGAVKRTLEGAFGRVRVRGEITECKRHSSGHVYFCLKDQTAKLGAVIWRSTAARIATPLENGVEVIATGRLSSYPDRSSYQLIIDRVEYAGVGALLARIEMLRVRLAAEGLFDPARKRALPMLPEVIGVITSPTGAVIQDIRTTITRRFPRRIVLWPVPVQGEGAAARIAAAIAGFNALLPGGEPPRPQVLIVARGGGSLEDLMPFNDEAVARAAARSGIPLISAVGHETDVTLIDHASDRRAATPTAAAELAIAMRADLLADLQHKLARLSGGLNRAAQECRLRLARAERGLPDLPALIGTARQRLDDRSDRLLLAWPNLVASRRALLDRLGRALPRLPALVAIQRERVVDRTGRLRAALPGLVAARRAGLGLAGSRLNGGLRQTVADVRGVGRQVMARLTAAPLRSGLREARTRLDGLAARLEGASPLAILGRGYALVADAAGRPLTAAAAVKPGAALRLRFADGEVRATADKAAGRQGVLPL